MWKKSILILMLLAIVLIVYSLYSGSPNNQPLRVYIIFQEDEGRILLEKFKKKTEIPYEIIRMSSGEASYHLLNMNKTGIDVVLGGPADLHEQLKNSGKSVRYSSNMSVNIPEQYKNKEGFWTGMYMGALAIGVNQTVWRQDPVLASLPLPQRYEDLLRPELKGKLEIPDPETSGTGYTLLASLAQQRGEDEAIQLMQALNKQSSSTTFAGITSAQRLAMGDVAVVVCFLGDQLRFTNSGYDIKSYIPPQAGWEIGAVSILKSGNNTAAAKKLVDFVLSKDVQTDYMNTAFSLPVLPGIMVNPLLSHVKLENLLVPYRFDIAAQHREQLLKRWRSVK